MYFLNRSFGPAVAPLGGAGLCGAFGPLRGGRLLGFPAVAPEQQGILEGGRLGPVLPCRMWGSFAPRTFSHRRDSEWEPLLQGELLDVEVACSSYQTIRQAAAKGNPGLRRTCTK